MPLLAGIPLLWRIVGPLLIVGLVLGVTYNKGRHDMNAKWELQWNAEKLRIAEEWRTEQARQAAATAKLNEQYNATVLKHGAEIRTLEDQQQEYAQNNAALEERLRSCRAATRNDVERLRKLAEPGGGTKAPLPPKRPFWLRGP